MAVPFLLHPNHPAPGRGRACEAADPWSRLSRGPGAGPLTPEEGKGCKVGRGGAGGGGASPPGTGQERCNHPSHVGVGCALGQRTGCRGGRVAGAPSALRLGPVPMSTGSRALHRCRLRGLVRPLRQRKQRSALVSSRARSGADDRTPRPSRLFRELLAAPRRDPKTVGRGGL